MSHKSGILIFLPLRGTKKALQITPQDTPQVTPQVERFNALVIIKMICLELMNPTGETLEEG